MKKQDTAKMHKNHRQRLRERYERDGIESLEDYRALEMFLFHAIPVKDTYPIAHALLERFGSIDGVFSAKYEELCEVEGVGPKTASLITFTEDIMKRMIADQIAKLPFDSNEQIMCYLLWSMKGLDVDTVLVMYLSAKNMLIECKNYSKAKNSYINIFDDIREKAIDKKFLKIVVAHKHPKENPGPSFTDIRTTEMLIRICKENKISLIEHYVVSGYTCHGIVKGDIDTFAE